MTACVYLVFMETKLTDPLIFLGNKLKFDTFATIDRDFDIYRLKGKNLLLYIGRLQR